MSRPVGFRDLLLLAVVVWGIPQWASAQEVRRLAPGVLTVIPSEPKDEETFQGPLPLNNITRQVWDPPFEPRTYTLADMATKVVLRRNIWNLEFAFKPLRLVQVDIPQMSGKMQQKLIWYMVYRVKNKGQHLSPLPQKDDFGHTTYDTETIDEVLNYTAVKKGAIRFFPHIVFRSLDLNKEYLDRVIPVAIPVIQEREMRGAKLYNTVEITRVEIPVSTATNDQSVWGVMTWEDIDPRTKFFGIFIQGLTNAYQLGANSQGKIVHLQKTLQLNFWRPGDTLNLRESEIRYGIPAYTDPTDSARALAFYNLSVRVDHLWTYR
ncbi:MAG: hypothetical protein NTY19_11570 [Planctomycetota bacterium]|nr:hypothetical protein [Planctomycetota bacterium]